MKKTLVAVAALFATGAFAQVSITGVMESTYNLNGTAKGMATGMNGGSEFRLGGSEDLGNGMKANFLHSFVQNHNVGGTPSSYQSFVGLSGDFGTVRLGQVWAPITLVGFTHDAMGGAAVSGNLVADVVNNSNSITYDSPSFAGVSLSVQGSNQTAATESTGYSLNYAAGGFSAGYGSNTVGTAKAITIMGASYDFGMAKLFLSSKTQSGTKDASGFGVSVPVGAATLIASSSTQGTGVSDYTLVGKYNLSKRTVAYVQNRVTDATAAGKAATTNSIGIQHAF